MQSPAKSMCVKGWGKDMAYPDYFDIPFDHKNHVVGDYPECSRTMETFLCWVGSLQAKIKHENSKRSADDQLELFFRGACNYYYSEVPSIFRNKGLLRNEDTIFNECISKNPQDFSGDKSTFDMLVKMQHYGVPTRLLDVTKNPLVALYFATRKSEKPTGKVTAFIISRKKILYPDDIRITMTATLTRQKQSDWLYPDVTTPLENLYSMAKREEHFFEYDVDLADIQKVYFVSPKQNNPRIIRQDGAFLLFGSIAFKDGCPEIISFEETTQIETYFKQIDDVVLNLLTDRKIQNIGLDEVNKFFSNFSALSSQWESFYNKLIQSEKFSLVEKNQLHSEWNDFYDLFINCLKERNLEITKDIGIWERAIYLEKQPIDKENIKESKEILHKLTAEFTKNQTIIAIMKNEGTITKMERFIVCKDEIADSLDKIGVNKERLFPELEVLGEELKRRYSQPDIAKEGMNNAQ